MVAMTLFMPPGSVCKVATSQGIWSVTKTRASSICAKRSCQDDMGRTCGGNFGAVT